MVDRRAEIIGNPACLGQDGIKLAQDRIRAHGLPLATPEQYQALFTAVVADEGNRELARQRRVCLDELIEEVRCCGG